jgi:hypothetical protein
MMVICDPIGWGRCKTATKENMAQMMDGAISNAVISTLLALGFDCQYHFFPWAAKIVSWAHPTF